MYQEIEILIENIKADYANWWLRSSRSEGLSEVQKDMVAKFNESIEVVEGRNYIKIITDKSVWGFIVCKEGKFRVGDILKAASWKAPATNKARGNIIDGGYTIRWTGPLYL